ATRTTVIGSCGAPQSCPGSPSQPPSRAAYGSRLAAGASHRSNRRAFSSAAAAWHARASTQATRWPAPAAGVTTTTREPREPGEPAPAGSGAATIVGGACVSRTPGPGRLATAAAAPPRGEPPADGGSP